MYPHRTHPQQPDPASIASGLTYRARKILFALITEYIATGAPVASRTLAKRYGLGLSPATIRNELMELEELGLLWQPHVSAGRVPTAFGLRLFIDALLRAQKISESDRNAVLEALRGIRPGVDDILQHAARILASLSGTAALVARRVTHEPLHRLQFLPLGERRLVAILILRSGSVHHQVIALSSALEAHDIEGIHRYLEFLFDTAAKQGVALSLVALRNQVARAIEEERDAYHCLRKRMQELLEATSEQADSRSLLIEGQEKLFSRAEFSDPEKIRRFLRAFEDKERLLALLERTISSQGVHVFLGTEATANPEDIGMISSTYSASGHTAGCLGLIGPTRLDYAKLVPLVAFTAHAVSRMLDGLAPEETKPQPSKP
ncbi:MAG: heat-inducible transcriptional repressor HrcA [Deltaproteobacteria bacterium]|nr:heat-inducible transcriptional repressor HrcA [Deltaproteobacteria bacterium]